MANKDSTLTGVFTDIADAIRAKLGVQTQYKPGQMADAIESIFAGGKSVDVKIENQVFSIACEDEAKLEAILDKIEKGFCGAVFNM